MNKLGKFGVFTIEVLMSIIMSYNSTTLTGITECKCTSHPTEYFKGPYYVYVYFPKFCSRHLLHTV